MECHLRLCSFLLSVMPLLLFPDLHFVVSANQPQISPTTSPESLTSNSPSPSPNSSVRAPGPSANFNSPPSPLLPDLTTPPTQAPSPLNDAKDLNHGSKGTADDKSANSEASASGGGGLKGGQKAGIAIGVIVSAFIVGMVGIIYKKRQDNLRRAQYSYTARREIL